MRVASVAERAELPRTEPPDPSELVRRSAAGDLDAFGELYRASLPAVQRFLSAMRLPLDAHALDDAAQETYLRLFRGLAKYDPGRPLVPWVLGIARLVALEASRAARPPGEEGLAERGAPDGDPVRQAARGEERELVQAALASLAPEHRTVIVLRHTVGLSMKELAQALAVSAPTARAHLAAAGTLLAGELRRRGVVPEGGAR